MDCLTLKTALSSNAYDGSEGGNLFREIKYLLQFNFVEYKVAHCQRSCNRVAHKLASLGVKLSEGRILLWHDALPEAVISLLTEDLTPVSS
jgi:hypothetical protein